jgi:tryptophanyl-tRNA synthetase
MSKSATDVNSRILLTDTASQIKSKIRGAVTDSIQGITYDPVLRPGTSNLLGILAACTDEDVIDVAKRYASKHHGDLKADVADAIEQVFSKPRAEFERLKGETAFLMQVAEAGAARARELSGATIRDVRRRVGLA